MSFPPVRNPQMAAATFLAIIPPEKALSTEHQLANTNRKNEG